MTQTTLKIRLVLQIVHLALKACAIFVNMNDVAEKNVRKTAQILESIKNVGFIMCAKRCEALSICNGFNFHKIDRLCELLSGQTSQNQFRQGWWYVDNIEWMKNMGISIYMEEKKCGNNERIIQLSSGAGHCDQVVSLEDCQDPRINTLTQINGVYRISPQKSRSFYVFCDFEASGGPWTVIQARVDGSVNFTRNWIDYKNGFGNLTGSFWLGNDNMHSLLSAGYYSLRIDMEYFDGVKIYAEYSTFYVAGEEDKYRLHVGGYSGNAGNAMAYHNGMKFTTKDQDNDAHGNGNCAAFYKGGWWFKICFHGYLNGIYYNISPLPAELKHTGIHWSVYRKDLYSLKMVKMKVRK